MRKNTMHHPVLRAACPLLLLILACDGVAGPDYPGETLAQIRGEIIAELVPPPAKVVLVWEKEAGDEQDHYLREFLEVTSTDFPAEFQLDITEPPIEDVLFDGAPDSADPGEPKVAFGLVTVLREDAELGWHGGEGPFPGGGDSGEDGESEPSVLLGGAENHAVAYLEGDVPPESALAGKLGGALGEGFHLMRYNRPTQAEIAAHEACLYDWLDQWYADHPECDPGFPDEGCDPCLCDATCGEAPSYSLSEEPDGFDTLIPVRINEDVPDVDDDLRLPAWLD